MGTNALLNKKYVNQYDYNKLREMVEVFISLIRSMQLELGDVNSIKITPSYDMKYSSFVQPTTSGIESFLINNYNTEKELKICISKYIKAFNQLNMIEKEVFIKTFLQEEKDCYMFLNSLNRIPLQKELTRIRKSAVIKFSCALKFHRLMYVLYDPSEIKGGDVDYKL